MGELSLQKVGPQFGGTGTGTPFTANITGAQRVTSGHGDFMDAALGGRLYTFGLSNTALVAANAIATGLTSTAQLVIGVWNPLTSGVNIAILMAIINTTTVANTAVSPGGFMWVFSATNGAITTGSTPINCKTLTATGSMTKAFAVSTALTGLSNNLAVFRSSAINSINAAGPATAIHQPTNNPLELVNGSIIVPPGGVIGIMNQVSTTTVNVSVGLVWEEIPALL